MATLFRRLLDRPGKPSPTSKLRVEHLEARDVPATITVTDLGDTITVDGEVTLREALNSLNNATAVNADVVPVGAFGTNDTVLFEAGLTGTITLGGSQLYLNVPATITGQGAAVISVSGNDNSRILYIGLDTAGQTVTISGLTFVDGDAQNNSGGAIFNDDAALVLTDMVFESNTTGSTGSGGALYHSGPSLSITNGTFTNNYAYSDGGAILLNGGTLTISGSTFGTAGNGNSTGDDDGGAIAISNTSGATITNSTFTENYAYDEGGAISIDFGSLTISGSSFTDNEAGDGDGGAISGENFGTLSIDGSDFTGNQSEDDGGAIGIEGYFVTITNSSFTNNSSDDVGGAIFLYEGRFTLDNVTISNNTAGGGGGGAFLEDVTGRIVDSTISGNDTDRVGGGLYLSDVKSVTIERTVITGNTANASGGTFGGGGIYLYGVLTLIDSIVSNNSAAYGAGISSFDASTLTIRGSTISGNTATGAQPDPTASFSGGGGGIFLYNAELLIENSTISGNTAVTNQFYGGAGIALYGGTATIRNTTIAFNTLTGTGTGSGLFVSGSTALTGIVNLENTLIGSNTGGPDLGFGDAASGDPTDANFTITATNSLIEDPGAGTNLTLVSSITGVDPLLGALANNGSTIQAGDLANLVTIQTHALLAGSPAIGGGNNSFVTNIANDQRGTGFTRIIGANVDIGSFEASTKAVPVNNVFAAGPGAQNGNGGGTIVAYNADGSVKATINAFPGFTGGVRVVTADVNNDGVDDYVVGAGPGGSAIVKVFDGATNAEIVAFEAYPAFFGGVYVAAGDFNKDGFAEVVVSPDQGGAPLVTVFDGQDLAAGTVTQLIQFLGIDDTTFFGGARIAVGDVNGDTIPDIAVAAGFLGGPRISVWSGATVAAGTPPTLLANFFAFESTLRNGAFVALGDINGDGFADLILGGGPGGGPRVRIADGKGVLIAFNDNLLPDLDQRLDLQLGNFFAGDPDSRGGVRLGVADLDGDGVTDIITGTGDEQAATVTVYAGSSITPTGGTPPALLNLTPFPELTNGVFVG